MKMIFFLKFNYTLSIVKKGGVIMTIGEKLKQLRGDKKTKDVAKDLNVTVSALSNYENDYRVPRDEVKKKIADYYKKSVEEIFF
jgi:transcriptional regulator